MKCPRCSWWMERDQLMFTYNCPMCQHSIKDIDLANFDPRNATSEEYAAHYHLPRVSGKNLNEISRR